MPMTLDNDRRELSEAEQRLFAALGIEHRSERLPLTDAPVDHARVIETGEGPPLLLVHSAGRSASLWAPLVVHLTHRRCLAVDLPGCGLTDPFDHRGIDLRSHATSFLAAVLDALGLDDVPIVANPLGSTYSLCLASAEPARISHLALFGAPGVALPGGRGSLAMALYSRPRQGPVEVGGLAPAEARCRTSAPRQHLRTASGGRGPRRDVRGRSGHPAHQRADDPKPHAGAVLRADAVSPPRVSDDELARVSAPTRFVWGSEDRFQHPDDGRRATGLMPDAELVEVRGGPHPWWDDAESCAAQIDDQLRTSEQDPASES